MKALKWICWILLVIGGLNWGLVGVAKFDLVGAIFGPVTVLARIVHTLVGLAAIYAIATAKQCCKS